MKNNNVTRVPAEGEAGNSLTKFDKNKVAKITSDIGDTFSLTIAQLDALNNLLLNFIQRAQGFPSGDDVGMIIAEKLKDENLLGSFRSDIRREDILKFVAQIANEVINSSRDSARHKRESTAGGTGNRFRKKPVVIEAIQFDGNNRAAIREFTGLPIEDGAPHIPKEIFIVTLEGTMVASPGDWIIKGVKGEFYPCKPDIFTATYDAVLPVSERGQGPMESVLQPEAESASSLPKQMTEEGKRWKH